MAIINMFTFTVDRLKGIDFRQNLIPDPRAVKVKTLILTTCMHIIRAQRDASIANVHLLLATDFYACV